MESSRRLYIILASILLHILLLFLWESALRLKLFDYDAASKALPENDPIVFDLQPPERPREVIETPEDAKVVEHQKKADLLSDKNALARNLTTNPSLKVDEAFARGVIDSHELPAKPALPSEKEKTPRPENEMKGEEEKEAGKKLKEAPDIKGNMVAYRNYERKRQKPMARKKQGSLPRVAHDNRTSSTLDIGGLSFNTYDWDFAPYMLLLKKKIQNNIFPPARFYLGMVKGESRLRFKIYPDGKLKDLEILGYEGDKSLMETSYNAIDALPVLTQLPQHFPAPYLEVTAKFSYINQNEKN